MGIDGGDTFGTGSDVCSKSFYCLSALACVVSSGEMLFMTVCKSKTPFISIFQVRVEF